MAIRIRRGLSTDRTSITPESGEFLYDTDTDLVYIGDGTTAGGILVGGSGVIITASDTNTVDLTVVANNLTADVRYQNTADVLLSDDASGLKADLTTTGVSANTYGNATNVPQLTVDSKGRITAVTPVAISFPAGITLETNYSPNGDQNLLNLVDGTNISITDDNAGNITISNTMSPVVLQTNNSPNGDQNLLNLKDGTNITISDDGFGGVTISSTPGVTLETNYSPNGSQTLLNLVDGTNISITDDNSGNITIANTMSPVVLQTNGSPNGDQLLLNLVDGTNITITDDGVGNVTIASTPGVTLETNYSPNGDQTLLNLVDGTNITITDDGVGNVTISSTPGVTLETNYSPNGDQTLLNLVDGTNISITDDGLGNITIDNTLSPLTLQTNGSPNGSQTLLNLVEGQNINLTDNGLGSVTIDSLGGILHGTASGTDTYTVTISGVSSYNDGDAYLIRFTNGNTTTATLNINGLGAKPLYRNNDGQLIGGDIWDGAEMLCVYNSTADDFQCIGTSPNSLFAYVTNADSVTITKGQPVYAFGGTGDRMTVKLAYNTSDATSAQTVGLVYSTSIAANQKGFIIIQGLLDNLSTLPTSTWADGDPVYLGDTAGSKTPIKPYAPNHLVYLGVVTTASNGNAGRMYVRVQNGYELEELHDVAIHSPAPVNNDVLYYNSPTDLWKAAQIDTILGYSPENVSNKSTTTTLGTSNTLYPTQNAVKTYVDNEVQGPTVGSDLYLFYNY